VVRRFGGSIAHLSGDTLCLTFDTHPGSDVLDELAFLTGYEVRVLQNSKDPNVGLTAQSSDKHRNVPDTDKAKQGHSACQNCAEENSPLQARDQPVDDKKLDSVSSSLVDGHTESKTSTPLVANDAPRDGGLSCEEYVGGAPYVVNQILNRAISGEASDIHIERYRNTVRIRFRMDGVLHKVGTVPTAMHAEVVARIKILASLDIAEKRLPQDGRMTFTPDTAFERGSTAGPKSNTNVGKHEASEEIDLRVSTLPTAHGEKVVLRVLDRSDVDVQLDALGLTRRDRSQLEEALKHPNGLILMTGPTGSGKTTTLYASLRALDSTALNIQTIEDPSEYELPGVNQAQIKQNIGFDFPEALRAFLRQDPDVIMVGEIRDRDTAEIAIRASLTGHLVFSTLHTNDACATIGRLLDMGVAPYLVASALNLVGAQRLLRRLCPKCSRLDEPTVHETKQFDTVGLMSPASVRRPVGCPTCNQTGYKGRTAIFEMLPITDQLIQLISDDEPAHTLRANARNSGVSSLRHAAMQKVFDEVTSVEEAVRQTYGS
jgi:type II secretory ATPase GspE/PulE/Tfp pilus assembly ATPase PilB-like protein